VDAQHRQLNSRSLAEEMSAGNQPVHFSLCCQPVDHGVAQRETTALGNVEGRDRNVMIALFGAEHWFGCR
jgi:hypothetical protein